MKFSGKVGFWVGETEVKPGIWESSIVEKNYYGDINRSYRRFQPTDNQNDNFSTNNQVSILSDLYAQQNWSSIRYIVWNGAKLKVTSIELSYPRILLEVGGIYNGENETGSASVTD